MRLTLAVGLGATLLLTACGAGASTGTDIALPEPAPGPVPTLAVTPDAAIASPLPEIAVRQINGDGGWVQFRNELPAEQPLLIWFWAPH